MLDNYDGFKTLDAKVTLTVSGITLEVRPTGRGSGSAIGITTEMYRVNATAVTNAGAMAEVEAKISYVGPGSGNGSAAGGGY